MVRVEGVLLYNLAACSVQAPVRVLDYRTLVFIAFGNYSGARYENRTRDSCLGSKRITIILISLAPEFLGKDT